VGKCKLMIPSNLEAIAKEALGEYVDGAAKDLRQDVQDNLLAISVDTAAYAIAYAMGDPRAQADMAHLRAQAALLAARAELREHNRLVQTLETVAVTVATVLGKALIASL
jgi:hypothetical protein